MHRHLLIRKTPTLVLAALLLTTGLWIARPAAAQIPESSNIGYGQTVEGEVSGPNGAEHYFTGCADESVSISVTADDFAPRIALYAQEDDQAITNAVAPAGETTVTLTDIGLPASTLYTIVVSGRSRGDRGAYSLILEGTGPNNRLADDLGFQINLLYGDLINSELEEDRGIQWNFRGCAGDEIRAEITGDGFAPSLALFAPIAESALATAEAEEGGESATLRHTLPVNGLYNLYAGALDWSEAGEYTLSFELEGRTPPTPEATPEATEEPTEETPTVISELTPTPTATPTPGSGPRPRRGTPIPATPTTFSPTPTPEYEMPGGGESAFRIIDVSSRFGPVNHAAYSPDGFVIATAGEDGVVRAWDAFDGKLIQSMEGHEDRVNKVAFSPNDEWIASAGDDGTVRLWDQAGDEVATIEIPDSHMTSIAFSPDSTLLVVTAEEGDVMVWDLNDESLLLELESHEPPVYTAIFSPDGSQIATADGLGVVRLWDATSGELIDSRAVNAGPGSGDPILSLAYSSDGSVLVVGGVQGVNDETVQFWNLASENDPIDALPNHGEWGSTAALSPDDAYLLSAQVAEPGHDGPVPSNAYIWNMETGELAIALVGYPDSVVTALFSPDGDELMTSDGSYLYLWPEPMIQVFAAAYGYAIGVQIPEVTPAPATPTPRATATRRATPTPTATQAATPTPTPAAQATPTPTPFVPVVLELFCTVTTDRLNLRPGPGTNFNPPTAVLVTGDLLVVTGRNEDSSWLQVDVLDVNLEVSASGWVSADFVFCIGDVEDAPVVE